ncbi:MAG: hypothetical protein Q9223_003405 [Gallowayella weberi]
MNPNDLPADLPQQLAAPQPIQPAIIVQGHTIKEGAAPVTIGGKPIIYSKGSVYVGDLAAPAPSLDAVPGPAAQPKEEAKPINLGGFEFAPVIQPAILGKDAKPANARPAVVIQDQTIQQGAPPVTVNGNKVCYSGKSLHVGSTAIPIHPPKPGQPPSIPVEVQGMAFTLIAIPSTVGKEAASPTQQGSNTRPAIIVKGQTITENGPPATINGKPVVYSGGAVYAAGTKVTVPTLLPGQAPASPIHVAGFRVTPQPVQNPVGKPYGEDTVPAVIVAGHTLKEYAPAITVNGAKLAYSSGSVYVNGKAAPIPTSPPSTPSSRNVPLVLGGLTVYAAPSAKNKHTQNGAQNRPIPIATVAGHIIQQAPFAGAVIIDGTTLTTGGNNAVTISGTPISLNPTGLVIAGASTIRLPTPPPPQTTATATRNPISRNENGDIVIDGKTLHSGDSAITINGTPYSLAPTALLAGSRTITLPLPPTTTPPPSLLTLPSTTLTPNAHGLYPLAGGTTLTPDGAPVTVNGTRIRVAHDGNGGVVLVVGTSTSVVGAATVTTRTRKGQNRSKGVVSSGNVEGSEATGTAGVNRGGEVDTNAALRVQGMGMLYLLVVLGLGVAFTL